MTERSKERLEPMLSELKERLEPMLSELQEEIDESVEQICGAPPLEQLDTGELIRFEEKLSMAADAAKRAVSVRRRLRVDTTRAESDITEPDKSDGAVS